MHGCAEGKAYPDRRSASYGWEVGTIGNAVQTGPLDDKHMLHARIAGAVGGVEEYASAMQAAASGVGAGHQT